MKSSTAKTVLSGSLHPWPPRVQLLTVARRREKKLSQRHLRPAPVHTIITAQNLCGSYRVCACSQWTVNKDRGCSRYWCCKSKHAMVGRRLWLPVSSTQPIYTALSKQCVLPTMVTLVWLCNTAQAVNLKCKLTSPSPCPCVCMCVRVSEWRKGRTLIFPRSVFYSAQCSNYYTAQTHWQAEAECVIAPWLLGTAACFKNKVISTAGAIWAEKETYLMDAALKVFFAHTSKGPNTIDQSWVRRPRNTNTCGPSVVYFPRMRETDLRAVISSQGATLFIITAWQRSFIVVRV